MYPPDFHFRIGVSVPGRVFPRSGLRASNKVLLHEEIHQFPDGAGDTGLPRIEDDAVAAGEIARVLKPGGTAVLTFPVNCAAYELRDNPEFGLVRMYSETCLSERIIRPSGLKVVATEIWPISDRYARAPLWEYSRFGSVLKTLRAYGRIPQRGWPDSPNTLGHHIGVLVLRKEP